MSLSLSLTGRLSQLIKRKWKKQCRWLSLSLVKLLNQSHMTFSWTNHRNNLNDLKKRVHKRLKKNQTLCHEYLSVAWWQPVRMHQLRYHSPLQSINEWMANTRAVLNIAPREAGACYCNTQSALRPGKQFERKPCIGWIGLHSVTATATRMGTSQVKSYEE